MAFLRRTTYAAILAVFAALFVVAVHRAAAPRASASPAPIVSTEAIHAAFTLNLTRFITWPEQTFSDATQPLVIGTFPRDPINTHLDAAVRNETWNGRPIQTIRLQSLDDLRKCHAVFLSKGNARRAGVLNRLAGRPVLTISDADGFLELGGHVRFVSQPPHTRLQISVENLKASGLTARSQLLRLATR